MLLLCKCRLFPCSAERWHAAEASVKFHCEYLINRKILGWFSNRWAQCTHLNAGKAFPPGSSSLTHAWAQGREYFNFQVPSHLFLLIAKMVIILHIVLLSLLQCVLCYKKTFSIQKYQSGWFQLPLVLVGVSHMGVAKHLSRNVAGSRRRILSFIMASMQVK